MPEQENVLDYSAAASLVSAHAARLPLPAKQETVAIEAALGRCLASPVLADRDQPPFDRSTRDGFAVRSADLAGAETSLHVLGQLRAGQPPFTGSIGSGEALEIMTGAPMPHGADAVLMIEHTKVIHNGPPETPFTVIAQAGRTLQPGDNVVAAGSEARAGAMIIPAGTRLSPMHIGAVVSAGAANVTVFAQPRVAILATGDELVEPGSPVASHQIRNSNSYSLAAQVIRAGGIPVRLPIVRDSRIDIRSALTLAMDTDLILLSGGVSMGKFDFVEDVLLTLDADFLFTGVRIQPGKPLVFGSLPDLVTKNRKYFFGLPGNPVSTMVTFALFAAPLIRSLGGETNPQPLFARARLTSSFNHQGGTTRFLPADLHATWNSAEVAIVPWQGSGDLAATARANCFVVIPPDQTTVEAGDEVSVLLAYS